jgi:oxaloacetate decarboxylase (Na+ extruding) subunit alpha
LTDKTDNKTVEIIDTTFRDAHQSNWGMWMRHGMYDAVASEMDHAGFFAMDVMANLGQIKMAVRYFREDPWETFRMFKRKLPNTRKVTPVVPALDMYANFDPPRELIKFFLEVCIRNAGLKRASFMSNTIDERWKHFPWIVPFMKSLGQEVCLDICYAISPRHTDEYYANLTMDLMKFEPDGFKLKDAGGLLTPERIKTLLPAIQKNAGDVPIELHTHCTSTFAPAVIVEAMKLGVRRFHAVVPPLAWGTSHTSIYNVIHNARSLGLTVNVNPEPLKVVEERLTRIAKQENLMIGRPLEYDHGVYTHMVPGGVMGTLRLQLTQMGLLHKLPEVLEEVPKVHADLGYPIMISPHSQYIVAQATVNVAVGERWKEPLDAMVDFALGYFGVEDTGVNNMDPNVKDKLLNHPNAKKRADYLRKCSEESASTTVQDLRRKYGMTGASDEDFLLYYIMNGDEEIKKMRAAGPPKAYFTGKEPLVVLLKELSKDKDISRLQMQKGSAFFEFHQK